ncbi:cytochrome c oxidase cbb3-type subunit 3 [Albimonas donghaensis]|uniref:Cbb3-type cytochrome c oxidase subunit n=1 Tax=Albimonas donghaensis TaxID=356660 RepID=A0A1H2VT93_9RHOB|nr:cytochrome-c oxidase, cbb3-type subunit III [Albimonas donghaensis]SDW71174.1 cytochrome c oxidase cbb3-type subunit 3 [Albimonas donghaensis]
MADHNDDHREVDEVSGVQTTGHEWDEIKELDNPMPRWWLYTFYATVIWGVAYTVAMPSWPLISEAFGGVMGYSSRTEVTEAIAGHKAAQSVYTDRIAEMGVDDIAADDELMQFAQAGGAAIFRTWCAQCHGAGAAGGIGYPNLNDDDWLWGGTRQAIYDTIAHGVRWDEDPDTRFSEMPAFGVDGLLEKEQVAEVVEYVYGLTHDDADPALADPGAVVFADNCVSCHGEDAGGMQDLGAPSLTDRIWLYGGDREALTQTVTYSRRGVMPSWVQRLGEADVKQVALYVHSLGGGETE